MLWPASLHTRRSVSATSVHYPESASCLLNCRIPCHLIWVRPEPSLSHTPTRPCRFPWISRNISASHLPSASLPSQACLPPHIWHLDTDYLLDSSFVSNQTPEFKRDKEGLSSDLGSPGGNTVPKTAGERGSSPVNANLVHWLLSTLKAGPFISFRVSNHAFTNKCFAAHHEGFTPAL